MSNLRITLRPAEAADEPLLRALFADARRMELCATGLAPREVELLIEIQFRAQAGQRGAGLPGLQQSVVVIDGAPVGRLLLEHRAGETRIVDIALLAALRGRGFGSSLLRSLQREAAAAGRLMGLRVARGNAAHRFYRRLGFREVAADELHVEMAWEGDARCPAQGDIRERRVAAA
jgi:ribosomal protein S18 acetylase RimI-like enzyme